MFEQTSLPVPTASELRRAARWFAVEKVPNLLYATEPRLKEIAGERAEEMRKLVDVPGKVETWAYYDAEQEVLRIAALRRNLVENYRVPRGLDPQWVGKASRYLGADRGVRNVIGEERAREMLFSAEEWRGMAEWDRERAARLDRHDLLNDTDLTAAVGALDLAAGAVAADDALRARRLIDEAPERARAAGFDPAGRNSLGPPTTRYKGLLEPEAQALLSKCSDEMAAHVSHLDVGTLSYLAAQTAKPWSGRNFDPKVTDLHSELVGKREAALDEGLAAAFRAGVDGSDFDELIADEMRAEVRRIDGEISQLPAAGTPDQLICRDSVAAVLHDATQKVLLERGVEPGGPGWEPGPEWDKGDDAGFGL